MMLLKQSTAVTVKIGPFIDDTDGKTAETALTIAQADVRLTKNGGNYAQKNDATACTHDELGEYNCPLNATDTGTLGRLKLSVQESGALPVWHEYMVVPANAYGALVAGTDYLYADVQEWLGCAVATPTVSGVPEVDLTHVNGTAAPETSGKLHVLDDDGNAPANEANQTTLLSRLSAARAGYLDNLNISENVAGTSEVTAIQNNTRCVRVVPTPMERPDSGSTVFRAELHLYDDQGNMEAPDSAPTVDVVNHAGTDRTGNLDSTTMTLVATGRYRCTYTVATGHAIEQLVFTFSVVEGGQTRTYGNTTQIVDTTAVDFTAADRTKLEALHGKLPSKGYLRGTADSDGGMDTEDKADVNAEADTALSDYDPPTKAELDSGLAALNDLSAAEAEAACDASLTSYDPPTKAELDAATADIYHADIQLTIDEANTKDEYTVTWFKSGVAVTSGITVPKIQVYKRADGTDLIAQTAMTQIGSTGSYKYDESTNRITAGEAVVAVATATIDAGGREFRAVLTRDSSA